MTSAVIKNLEFNEVFLKINQFKGRYRVLTGSAGSGKSVNVAQDFIAKLSDSRYFGANLMVVRKTAESHRDSTFAELCSAVRRMFGDAWEDFWKIKSEPMTLESQITGNKIIFRGMFDDRQREKIKSVSFEKGKLTWIWIEEATEISSECLDILDDRLRGKIPNTELYYQITLTFNPVSASHWIKSRFFDIIDDDVMCSKSTYLDNRFIDPSYHKRMMRRRALDPDGYRVYGLGEWGECGGLILPHYEVDELCEDEEYYDYRTLGQDFGYNHANCILLLGFKDDTVYVLRELYLRECDTSQIITMADEQMFPKNAVMYCDSAEPDRIKNWRTRGYSAVAVKKERGSVREQIDWLKRHRIIIDSHCINTISEIRSWKWIKDEKTGAYLDEPTPVNDDAMAALRYGIEGVRRTRLKNISKETLRI